MRVLLLGAGAVLLAAGLLALPALVPGASGVTPRLRPGQATTSAGARWTAADDLRHGRRLLHWAAPPASRMPGALSGGGYTLGGGFWQPSCVAAAVDVTIALDGETVILLWTPNAANEAYQLHRATTPYFTPTDATLRAWVAAGPWPDPDSPVAVGDPDLNYYYLVRPTCGASHVDAGRVGEFDFVLVPGN